MKDEAKKKQKASGNALLLRELVGAFVQKPDAITVAVEDVPGGEMLCFRVDRNDHPRVVGAMGKHIQALRTIFRFIEAREGRKVQLMLLEPNAGRREPTQPFVPNMDWNPQPVRDVLNALLAKIFTKPFEVEITSAEETSNIEIRSEESEQEICEALSDYLQPIFHAIGKQQGRQIYVSAAQPVPIAMKK